VGARTVVSRDGTSIAVFDVEPADRGAVNRGRAGRHGAERPPVILVHGTASDHTTWRVAGPLLAASRTVVAIDRRGRGASGDGQTYAIEREYEDVVAVATWLTERAGSNGVDVLGHSYGGRVALGAALASPAILRVVAYEGAPVHVRFGRVAHAALARLEADVRAGRPDRVLDRFLRAEVGFTTAGLAAYHANPVWPDRVAAAERTLLRELRAETSPAAGLAQLSAVRQPVLLILGSESPAFFRHGTERLTDQLADVAVVEIAGAAHAAHHTHAAEFVAAVEAFLDR
jgi:pimeloyl-ACP methyl ester carboxylesterase